MGSCSCVYQLDPLQDPRWNELIHQHPRASVFHSPQWLRALERAYGYRPFVLTSSPAGLPLADGLPLCEVNSWLTGRRLVSVPFSDHCEPLLDQATAGCDGFAGIWQHVSEKKPQYLQIRPIAFQPASTTVLRPDDSYVLHRLDLTPDLPHLYNRFHKTSIQQRIRRAEREKIDIREGTSPVLLQDFYRLLTVTRRRHGVPPQPLRWFETLIAEFGKDLRIRVAYKDGNAIAAMLTLTFKNTVANKYSGSDPDHRKLGGTALLFWQTIQQAKADGLEVFDMGRSDPHNAGLIAFKEYWGADPTPLQYWRVPQKPHHHFSSRMSWIAERTVSTFPLGVLRAIGTVLYKHIG